MPHNPPVLYHLPLAHSKNGEKGQAVDALHDALKIKDAFPEQQAATTLLEEIEAVHSSQLIAAGIRYVEIVGAPGT